MAQHYLINRKPQRRVRIRKKVADLERDGVSLDSTEMMYGGYSIPLKTLLERRFDDLGYTMLCSIETSLDCIRDSYEEAKTDAIGLIARLAGEMGMAGRDVFQMAQGIRPSTWDGEDSKYVSRNAFEFRAQSFGWTFHGHWSELRNLTLRELQVLYLQVERKQLVTGVTVQ